MRALVSRFVRRDPQSDPPHGDQPGPIHVTFIMEQQVGLKTFCENLRRYIDNDDRIIATWVPVTYVRDGGLLERLTFVPAGIRGTLRGRWQVLAALKIRPVDVRFFMTQVPAALGGRRVRRAPYLVMTDITPIQYDEMAAGYGHERDHPGLAKYLKHRVNRRVFREASALLPLSDWVAGSLVESYGVDPRRIEVLASGVDLSVWAPRSHRTNGRFRILFVGGDFDRKGGSTLLHAFRGLAAGLAELHVVTRTTLLAEEGIFIYHDMQPNTPELIDLFRACDVFVLPSEAEAFGQVLVEASAVGLPAIVSNVAAMPEIIVDGETGFVIEPGDSERLRELLVELIKDSDLRARLSTAARLRAEQLFSGEANARHVVERLTAALPDKGRVSGPTMPDVASSEVR